MQLKLEVEKAMSTSSQNLLQQQVQTETLKSGLIN